MPRALKGAHRSRLRGQHQHSEWHPDERHKKPLCSGIPTLWGSTLNKDGAGGLAKRLFYSCSLQKYKQLKLGHQKSQTSAVLLPLHLKRKNMEY